MAFVFEDEEEAAGGEWEFEDELEAPRSSLNMPRAQEPTAVDQLLDGLVNSEFKIGPPRLTAGPEAAQFPADDLGIGRRFAIPELSASHEPAQPAPPIPLPAAAPETHPLLPSHGRPPSLSDLVLPPAHAGPMPPLAPSHDTRNLPDWMRALENVGLSAAQGTGDIAGTVAGLEREMQRSLPAVDERLEQSMALERERMGDRYELDEPRIRADRAKTMLGAVEASAKTVQTLEDYLKALPEIKPAYPEGSWGRLMEDAASGMARFAPAMGVSALTPAGGFLATYAQVRGNSYRNKKEQGVQDERAWDAAGIEAAISTPLEFGGNLLQIRLIKNSFSQFAKATRLSEKATKVLRNFVLGSAGEGIEEVFQQFPEELADIYAKNPNDTAEQITQKAIERYKTPEFWKRTGRAGVVGVIGGAMLGGAGSALAMTQRGQDVSPADQEGNEKVTAEVREYLARLMNEQAAAEARNRAQTVKPPEDTGTAAAPPAGASAEPAFEFEEGPPPVVPTMKQIIEEQLGSEPGLSPYDIAIAPKPVPMGKPKAEPEAFKMDAENEAHFQAWLDRTIPDEQRPATEAAMRRVMDENPSLIEEGKSWPEVRRMAEGVEPQQLPPEEGQGPPLGVPVGEVKPAPKKNFQSIKGHIQRRDAWRERWLKENYGQPFQAKSSMGGDVTLTFTRSAKHPGKWQLTWFDKNMDPVSDTEYDSYEQGIQDHMHDVDYRTVEPIGKSVTKFPPAVPQEPAKAAPKPKAKPTWKTKTGKDGKTFHVLPGKGTVSEDGRGGFQAFDAKGKLIGAGEIVEPFKTLGEARSAVEGGLKPEPTERDKAIDKIIDAIVATEPEAKVVERKDAEGKPYFVKMNAEGTTFGTRFPTREAAAQDIVDRLNQKVSKARTEFEARSDKDLARASEFWAGELEKAKRLKRVRSGSTEQEKAPKPEAPKAAPEIKQGDIVEYNGEIWQVGFVNNLKWKGTVRLQKGPEADAKQLTRIPVEDLKLLPEGTPIPKAEPKAEPKPAPKPEPKKDGLHGLAESAARKAAAHRLKDTAQRMREKAEGKLNQARLENTPKRARQGEHARNEARAEIAKAETMTKIADGLLAGRLEHLQGVKAGTHVETLDRLLRSAEGDPAKAQWPQISVGEGVINGLRKDLEEKRGGKKLTADMGYGRFFDFDMAKRILDFAKKNRITSVTWQLESGYELNKRLRDMGITNSDELRGALEEYAELKAPKQKEDPIKKMEAEIRFQKIPGFFPTPAPVRARMMEAAGIEEGMTVLEPSAGKGDIADDIRAAGVEPDVVEINSTLADLLQAKGYRVTSRDFLELARETLKQYDRVLMNPPFEKGQDIDHVMTAFKLLKPGGRLVAIMSPGPFFRSDKKAQEFRQFFGENEGTVEDLPAGSFKGIEAFRETGTNTKLVVIDKRAEAKPKAEPAAEPKAEPEPEAASVKNPFTVEIGGVWDGLNHGQKQGVVFELGWTIKNGQLSAEGKRIADTSWSGLSDKEKELIGKHIEENRADLGEAPKDKEAPKDAKIVSEPGAGTLKPTEQKKWLLEEVDTAIKEAPDEQEAKGDKAWILFQVPGDGEFTVFNNKTTLREFKKMAEKFPTTPGPAFKLAGPASTKRSEKRLKGFEGWYYNPYKPRKANLIESPADGGAHGKPKQYYNGGYYSNGAYIVAVPSKPKLKHPVATATKIAEDDQETWQAPDLKKFVDEVAGKKGYEEATIAGEFYYGSDFDSKDDVDVHIKAAHGEDVVLNAEFLDSFLTLHPKAKPFIRQPGADEGPTRYVLFKDGGKVVGIIAGINIDKMPYAPEGINEHFTTPPGVTATKEEDAAEQSARDVAEMIEKTKEEIEQAKINVEKTEPLRDKDSAGAAIYSAQKRNLEMLEARLRDFEKMQKENFEEAEEAPAGTASAGLYATDFMSAERAEGPASGSYREMDFPLIEMPELVELAKELMRGRLPRVREWLSKNPGVQGYFTPRGRGKIRLKAKIFEDWKQAQAVLAHEIGHLIDYLPNHVIARGNILGRIASLRGYMKKVMPKTPAGPGELTAEDRKRLKAEAKKLIEAESADKWIDEEIERSMPITPEDVLAIWNATADASMSNPDLYKYVAGLDTAAKKAVVKEALKGQVAAELLRFAKIVREKTGKKIPLTPTEQDIINRYNELINAELKKRELLSEEEITNELKRLSRTWKPFDPQANRKYTKYRYSSVELYADAFSAMVNAPQLARAVAPKFYEAWFAYLDRKTEVKLIYDQILDTYRQGPDNVANERTRKERESFRRGDEAWAKKVDALPAKDQYARDFVDANHFVIKRVHEIGERNIPAGRNPRYALEDMAYSGSEAEWYMTRAFRDVVRPIEKAGMVIEDFASFMVYRRILAPDTELGSRFKLANPFGYNPPTAKAQQKALRERLGEENWRVLERAAAKYATSRKYVLEKLRGLYPDELINEMQNTDNYAKFDVVHYIEKRYGRGTGARIYRQIGTFADIANPFTATLMKDIAFIKSTNRQHAARSVVEFLRTHFPTEVHRAGRTRGGMVAQPPPTYGQIAYLETGKVRAWNVPKEIAEIFEENPLLAWQSVKVLRSFGNFWRTIFTEISLPYWLFNVKRDFSRALANLPGAWTANFGREWVKALKPAMKSTFGIPDAVIEEMQKGNMLISVSDIRGARPEDTQLERMLKQWHLRPLSWKEKVVNPFGAAFTYWCNVGRALERTTKVASYTYLKKKFPNMSREEMAHVIRNTGSPDFLRQGRLTPVTNNLFLFSNAMIQGYRGDIEAIKARPLAWTAKRFLRLVTPKLLMFAASMGYLGDDTKKVMEGASEYDKTNYLIIPIALTANGKSVYLRVPTDETGRFIGGILWKALNYKKPQLLASLFDYTAGQAPTINPTLDILGDAIAYASGLNPYDAFRGRRAINEQVFEAGGKRSHLAFASYIANKAGAHGVHRLMSDDKEAVKSELEQVLGIGLKVGPLARFLKVTDYGFLEQSRSRRQEVARRRTAESLDFQDVIKKVVKQEELSDDDRAAFNAMAMREVRDKILRGEKIENAKFPVLARIIDRNLTVQLSRRYGNVFLQEMLAAQNAEEKEAVLRYFAQLNGQIEKKESDK